MESPLVRPDQTFSGAADDFPTLLRRKGLLGPAAIVDPVGPVGRLHQGSWEPTEATTILAFKFSGGVLVAGDRRATSGNTVVYDRADKVLEIDRHSIMAIAGVPATAWEMARVLEHSFQYFRRTQLQEMSVVELGQIWTKFNFDMGEEQYLKVIVGKTGSLFATACACCSVRSW